MNLLESDDWKSSSEKWGLIKSNNYFVKTLWQYSTSDLIKIWSCSRLWNYQDQDLHYNTKSKIFTVLNSSTLKMKTYGLRSQESMWCTWAWAMWHYVAQRLNWHFFTVLHIFIPYVRSIILVFWQEEWMARDDSLYLKFWAKPIPFLRKHPFSIDIHS